MRIQGLGHVVLKVRDLQRSLSFYQGVLGLNLVAKEVIRDMPMAFFSISGNHHDLALMQVPADAPSASPNAPGLAHVALKVGDGLEALREARNHLNSHAVPIERTVNHRVAQSLYLRDPDGHGIELYVDADPRIWRDDPRSVAHSEAYDF